MKKKIVISDLFAAAISVVFVLPVFVDQRNPLVVRLAVVVALLVGLVISWKVTRERDWRVKTIYFVGICLGISLLVQMIVVALMP